MSTTIPEKDLHMVVIQKVIPHISDLLRTMECAFKTGQDAQLKATEKLAQEVKQWRRTVGDFTSRSFQLTFTLGRNRLLPQSFDHTLHSRERSFLPYFTCDTAHLSSLYFTFTFSSSPCSSSKAFG